MQGTYDASLVALSILIAALASFVAIEFAGRMHARRERWRLWLLGGSLAMGSGIWAMHFVGMSAFMLPVPISYDLGITVLSWVAAVAVSALALFIVHRGSLSASSIGLGALAMGAGICVMHYSGMGAMRMDPGIGYDPFWFTVSVLIAVAASAAALMIVARLREVRSWRDVGLRMGAAVVMGLAVAGMHYSGMAAAEFDPNAFCSSSNTLQGAWITTPTAIASLLGLGFAIFFTVSDARTVWREARLRREEARRVAELAFVDRETGLPNRPRMAQLVTAALRTHAGRLCVATLRLPAPDAANTRLAALADALGAAQPRDLVLARTGPDQLMVLAPGYRRQDVLQRLRPLWRQVAAAAGTGATMEFGLAESPVDGDAAQMLMFRAGTRLQPLDAGDGGRSADGDLDFGGWAGQRA